MIPNIKYDFEDLCIPNYGFGEWGPILATGNYKTEVLKKTNFKLSEKSFYVDMEYNVYSIEKLKQLHITLMIYIDILLVDLVSLLVKNHL